MPLVSVTSPQATLPNVIVGPTVLLPSEFIVRRGYEGPQVVIEWNEPLEPSSVTALRLVRRRFGFPSHENDGVILYDGPPVANVIADLNVEPCVCYYYKMFSFTTLGDIVVSASTEGFVIPITTGFFAEKTYEILPEDFKVSDKGQEREDEIRTALIEGPFSGSYPEVFNFSEDGSVPKGPLRRLLKLLGPMLDEPKGLLDCLINQLDVDEACLPNLEHLAALLGLSLNKELTPQKFRNEVRLQVEFLKIKGTIPGIQARLRSVSGVTPDILEQCNLVFYTNDLESLTLDFEALTLANFGTINDTVHLLAGYPDTIPFWLWFTVFMNVTGLEVDEATLRKWCIAIDESSPACHRGFLKLYDEYEDTLQIDFVDLHGDEDLLNEPAFPINIAEEADDVQVGNPALWLIISDPSKTLNTPDYTAVFAVPDLP